MVQRVEHPTKGEILKLLYTHNDQFLSGQWISEHIGCSRTAVWKHIQSLIAEGYRISSVQKKGYKLIDAPMGLSEAAVSAHLTTKVIGRHICFYDSIGSTQKKALRLADEGAEHGTVVLTNEQTSGRGRLGHTWQSQRGTNIALSLILRPELPIDQTPQLTLLTAVAAAETIEKQAGLSCGIKWPNDLLFEGKKLVGILTELMAEATYVKAVVIGIGFNVNTTAFPDPIKSGAASLASLTGKQFALAPIVQQFFASFETLYALYLSEGFKRIRPLWEKRALNLGKQIKVRQPGGRVLIGTALGINDNGVLQLKKADGTIAKVYSADVEWD